MSFTAAEIEQKISDFEESGGFESTVGGNVYEDLHYYSNYGTEKTVEVPGLGLLGAVESFGGGGMGDDYWVVFAVGDQLFRKNGYYASYDGGELDGDLYEVEAVEVSRTEYQKKS